VLATEARLRLWRLHMPEKKSTEPCR